jgi:integrase
MHEMAVLRAQKYRLRPESIADQRANEKALTAGELIDLFLDWVKSHRSDQTYKTRRNYTKRFGSQEIGGTLLRDFPADRPTSRELERFKENLALDGLNAQTISHAEASVRHCWNWGTKHPSPRSYLPPNYRPFSAVEKTYVPRQVLSEDDLITDDEREALFFCAELDPDQFRRHGLKHTVKRKGTTGLRRTGDFAELLRCYWHTGARTDELLMAEVGDLLRGTRQLVLGEHKRSKSARVPIKRLITLNQEAFDILVHHCDGKAKRDKLFTNANGRPWNRRSVAKRFERVKEIAACLKRPVRQEITIYDFRHLWISEAITCVDVFTVAKMAGTSVTMIERTYGHLANKHFQDAQRLVDAKRSSRKTSKTLGETVAEPA